MSLQSGFYGIACGRNSVLLRSSDNAVILVSGTIKWLIGELEPCLKSACHSGNIETIIKRSYFSVIKESIFFCEMDNIINNILLLSLYSVQTIAK